MAAEEQHLKDFLHEAGFLSLAQITSVDSEARRTDEPFSAALVRTGRMKEEEVRRATAKSLHIPFIELEAHEFDEAALLEIPEPFCRTHNLVPYKKEGNTLVILLLTIDTLEAVRALRLLYAVKAEITNRQTLKKGLLRYQRVLADRHASFITEASRAIEPPASGQPEALEYSADRLAVQQVIDSLLQQALSQRASDIHLEPRPQGLLVRYRIGRQLYDAAMLPPHTAQSIVARVKMLARLSLTTTQPQEGKFKLMQENTGGEVMVRVTTMPVVGRVAPEKVVLHMALAEHDRSNFALESLGFHGVPLAAAHQALQKQEGLIVVYGGETSGKTTLLYTLLDLLVDPIRSIATIEDTIELLLPGVMQAEVSPEEGITLSGRLRAALLMDPDVLMVSTQGAKQTAPAVAAANAGKLILFNVQAESFGGMIESLVRQGISQDMLAATLTTAIGTKLVRRLCHNHVESKLTRLELQELEDRGARLALVLETLKEEGCVEQYAQWKDIQFARAIACPECENGYHGRIGLHEVVPTTLLMKHTIRVDHEKVAQEAKAACPLTFLEDGIYKAARGQTSVEEVLAATL